jgi:hypothetical protein
MEIKKFSDFDMEDLNENNEDSIIRELDLLQKFANRVKNNEFDSIELADVVLDKIKRIKLQLGGNTISYPSNR